MTKTHMMSKTPTYNSWQQMMRRRYDPKHPPYKAYGAKGIIVCKRWHSFANFYKDMGERTSEPNGRMHSIHRLKNEEGYHPDNCVWADDFTQARLTGNVHIIEYGGDALPISEWAEITEQKYQKILMRLRYGWTPGQALGFDEPPPRDAEGRKTVDNGRKLPERGPEAVRSIEWRGATRTIVEWSELTGMRAAIIYARERYGWDAEKIFTTPVGAIQPRRGMGVGNWSEKFGKGRRPAHE